MRIKIWNLKSLELVHSDHEPYFVLEVGNIHSTSRKTIIKVMAPNRHQNHLFINHGNFLGDGEIRSFISVVFIQYIWS